MHDERPRSTQPSIVRLPKYIGTFQFPAPSDDDIAALERNRRQPDFDRIRNGHARIRNKHTLNHVRWINQRYATEDVVLLLKKAAKWVRSRI